MQLLDYREAEGAYDAIVSVEMIEAVGDAVLADLLPVLDRLLAPGGRIGLQAITIAARRMLATRDQYTWMHKYIFPGGALPSVRAIEETCPRHTPGIADRFTFGPTTPQTLRLWR